MGLTTRIKMSKSETSTKGKNSWIRQFYLQQTYGKGGGNISFTVYCMLLDVLTLCKNLLFWISTWYICFKINNNRVPV